MTIPRATFGDRHPLLRDALIGSAFLLPALALCAFAMAI